MDKPVPTAPPNRRKAASRPVAIAALAIAAIFVPAAWVLGQSAGPSPASAPATSAKPTEQEWQQALAIVRKVALNPAEGMPHRLDAVTAYVKLAHARGDSRQALEACRELAAKAEHKDIAMAALRTACHINRQATGTLAGLEEMMQTWKAGMPGGQGAAACEAARLDLLRSREHLMQLATRKFTPDPYGLLQPHWAVCLPPPPARPDAPPALSPGPAVLNFSLPVPACPHWATFAPTTGLPVLQGVTLPVYSPPPWYATLQFPLVPPEPVKR